MQFGPLGSASDQKGAVLRVLVTNDDGVRARGLTVLARGLADAGHTVSVAAPLEEASGAGAGVGALRLLGSGVEVERLSLPGIEELDTYGVAALPALIVIASCLGAYGPAPEIVVSGINPGRNTGRAVMHSGTVGAALTASHFGLRAVAVSIESGRGGTLHYETAAAVAVGLVERIDSCPSDTVLNANVPNLPLAALRGIRHARLSRSGLVRSALVGLGGDEASPLLQLDVGYERGPLPRESDQALSSAGYVALTPLVSVAEDMREEVQEGLAELLRDLKLLPQAGSL
jgi:5'-nucleotidase